MNDVEVIADKFWSLRGNYCQFEDHTPFQKALSSSPDSIWLKLSTLGNGSG